ncbi:prolyl oligopeptidase family serine peptidase [Embleya sp. NPDC050154]|uniref:prolyl oligopeptidase family serine peptidase n=1 Tax=Embleya sp. NPDC050154 TaxID=3363988 RepID=UPI003799F7B7
MAVVEAFCSDRKVVAGDFVLLVVDGTGTEAARIDTNGVDVTSTGRLDEDWLGWAGIAGPDTVVGEYDRTFGKVPELRRGTETFGGRHPELSFSAHGHAGVRHGYDRCPEPAVVTEQSVRTITSLSHPGADVRTPTLVTAGALDRCTPAGQARELLRALVEAGAESTLVMCPREGHGVRAFSALIDHCARLPGWFDKQMAPGPAA